MILAAREFLATLDLTRLRHLARADDYPAWLDDTTSDLIKEFPRPAKKWGVVRKAINIFTTQAFLNGHLATTFRLAQFGDVMETPLDDMAARELRARGGSHLPRWPGVGRLTPQT